MTRETARLKRLIEWEVGDCREDDLEQRLETLSSIGEAIDWTAVATDLRTLSALGSETRHRLVRLLAAAGDELCVCELSPLVDVSDSAVSHALSELTDAGLVVRRTEGRWRYYRTTERAEAVLAALADTRTATTGGTPT